MSLGVGGRSTPLNPAEYHVVDYVMEVSEVPVSLRPDKGVVARGGRGAQVVHRPSKSGSVPACQACQSDALNWGVVDVDSQLRGGWWSLCRAPECFRWLRYVD